MCIIPGLPEEAYGKAPYQWGFTMKPTVQSRRKRERQTKANTFTDVGDLIRNHVFCVLLTTLLAKSHLTQIR